MDSNTVFVSIFDRFGLLQFFMMDDVCFEHVLAKVAHFRAPESTTHTGTYELRDELYAEINPFYYHYARN